MNQIGMTAKSEFVPVELDAAKWSVLEPLYRALLERPIGSAAEFEQWLLDRSELDAATSEGRANLYIAMTCHTDDASISDAWSRYLDEVPPRLKPVSFELDKRQVELFRKYPLDARRYGVMERDVRVDVELFREENIPLETELAKLDQKYDQIRGAQTVVFRGREHTLPEMARHQQEQDRALREEAWRGVSDRMLADREAIDAIFDRMIELRHTTARNAGFEDFRGSIFRARRRFDYGPEECLAFHDAVERHCVPFLRRLDERRRVRLGLEILRPWDLSVDELGREPLRPFENGDALVAMTRAVFDCVDPELGGMFRSLGGNAEPGGALDLDTRRGKAPGGYQYMRDRSRFPFIFMNAAGLHRDVETMVHEAGHAFHSLLSRDEPLVHYRDAPIEFAEVASMTMELLTMPAWDRYYPDPSHLARAQRAQIEGSISLLPWIATIDAFQHWLYTHPGHTRDERTAAWLELDDRFGHAVSWEGLGASRESQWQRQSHLFGSPFYYVEYGIAQLGAISIWLRAHGEGVDIALKDYKRALALGGSRPLPELFRAAGAPFDFGADRVRELLDAVEGYLDALPDGD